MEMSAFLRTRLQCPSWIIQRRDIDCSRCQLAIIYFIKSVFRILRTIFSSSIRIRNLIMVACNACATGLIIMLQFKFQRRSRYPNLSKNKRPEFNAVRFPLFCDMHLLAMEFCLERRGDESGGLIFCLEKFQLFPPLLPFR